MDWYMAFDGRRRSWLAAGVFVIGILAIGNATAGPSPFDQVATAYYDSILRMSR
ncbi:MAG: hypothetical protein AWU57_925 [Marinobacter sp. T13-3]|nr:MAG: hypothetical protein AWU57_925 [Marinobacter sp. T13-3]